MAPAPKPASKPASASAPPRAKVRMLFGEDGDDDEGAGLRVNAQFADKYKERKMKEELTQLRGRLVDEDDDEEEDSEEDEPEDETGELVTPEIDQQVFRTLSLIKARDPSVYDSGRQFFSEAELAKAHQRWEEKKSSIAAKPRPMKLKDYERKRLLEEGPEAFGKADSTDEGRRGRRGTADVTTAPPSGSLTYVEEQEALRAMFRRGNDANAGDDEDDDLFVKRSKSGKELEAEEEDFHGFLLAQQKAEDQKKADELDALRRYWTDPNLDPNEAFLRDYLLNRGWVDMEAARVPSYSEVVGPSNVDDAEDMAHVEQTEEFEYAYNFRFEEPYGRARQRTPQEPRLTWVGSDGSVARSKWGCARHRNSTLVQTYARNDDESVRRKDTRRKEERQHRRELKELQHARKQEELQRLKNLKKMEILKKLREIERVSGTRAIGFEDVDLEAEFDPDEHDRRMSALFNDTYYAETDEAGKPVFPEDPLVDGAAEDVADDGDEPAGQEEAGDGGGDDDDDDDAPAANAPMARIKVPSVGPDGRKLTRRERENLKRRLKRAAKAGAPDPAAAAAVGGEDAMGPDSDVTVVPGVPSGPAKRPKAGAAADPEALARRLASVAPDQRGQVDALLDDYYSVNYEDLVGDQPTRFRYRKVAPATYGLSVEEILLADDRDLNAHISLKKLAPYRPPDLQKADRARASKAKRLKAFRERLNARWEIREDGTVVPVPKPEAAPAAPAAPAGAPPRTALPPKPKGSTPAASRASSATGNGAGKRAGPPGHRLADRSANSGPQSGAPKPWSKAARKAAALGVTPDRLASYMVQKRSKPGAAAAAPRPTKRPHPRRTEPGSATKRPPPPAPGQ